MAVYTKITHNELINFLKLYEVGELISWNGITEGIENTNYFIETKSQKFILTIYEKRVTKKDLPFFLKLMTHLNKNKFPCPKPIHNKQGNVLNSIKGKPSALFSFLSGKSVEYPTWEHCNQAGLYLSIIHKTSSKFSMQRENKLSISGWKDLLSNFRKEVNFFDKDLINIISEELEFISYNWPENLPQGIIHADLFPDNVFFENDIISGVIDFYFACNDFFAYDLAIAINAWCFNEINFLDINKSSALLNGYQKYRKLSEEEKKILPVLARGASLRFLLTRVYDSIHLVEGALVQPKDPLEYLEKLKYHRNINSFDEYING
ncbi:MAG: Homoserine kinase [Alphaproteobacteria bacterium MarineAlpha2_Bin1]|nr:MAG: Homoserine kinase [Alphaproteobacteria bacterium MarineAlpha2_Bin1]